MSTIVGDDMLVAVDVTKEVLDKGGGGCKDGLEEVKVINSTGGLDDNSDKDDIVKKGFDDEGADVDNDDDSSSLGELCLLNSGDL